MVDKLEAKIFKYDLLENKVLFIRLDEDDLSDEDVWRVAENATQYDLFAEFFNVPFPAPKNPRFTFIDLFAGIGGFRIAMQNLGGKCVYSSEFDAKAQESYLANYGEMPFGDITAVETTFFTSFFTTILAKLIGYTPKSSKAPPANSGLSLIHI